MTLCIWVSNRAVIERAAHDGLVVAAVCTNGLPYTTHITAAAAAGTAAQAVAVPVGGDAMTDKH